MAELTPPPIIRRSPRLVMTTSMSPSTLGGHTFFPTPNSIFSTPPREVPADELSSPLSSLPSSPESPFISSSPQKGEGKVATIKGLTGISVEEANRRSLPLPGMELQRLFMEAKNRGEVAKSYDTEVARFVNGKWMAPQKCKNCQKDSKKICNRKIPCSVCKKASKNCEAGSFMVSIAKVPHATVPQSAAAKGHPVIFAIAIIHGAHGQLEDGSWGNEEGSWYNVVTVAPAGRADITTSNKRRRVSGPSKSYAAGIDSDSMYNDEPQVLPTAKRRRSKKIKADDNDDFALADSPSAGTQARVVARAAAHTKTAAEKEMYYANIQNGKPEPFGQSPAVSKTRQAICETLDWFKCYQGGAYTNLGIVRGVLCDAGGSPRDKFDDSIIITRVGGGLESEGGTMIQTKDQDANSSLVRAFRKTMGLGLPVGVVAGYQNTISPVKWKAYYNVLAWFHITDVWCTKYDGLKTWMFRLEKINLEEYSWWSVKGSQHMLPDYDSHVETLECRFCNIKSKHIYSPGWTCLNDECTNYFNFGKESDETTLDFTEAFLNERTLYTGGDPGPITPPLLTNEYFDNLEKNGEIILGIEKQFKGGIVCPKCTHCIRRLEWTRWACENPECDFTHTVRQKIASVEAARVRNSKNQMSTSTKDEIPSRTTTHGLWKVSVYPIPGEAGETIGCVVHYKPDPTINGKPDGPDDLFREMQEIDLGMERRAARQDSKTREMVTSHFATNWGAPYKFGVAHTSRGFDEAPIVITKALKRLTWAGQQAMTLADEISEEYHDPNELLTIGYFEDSTIGYHDDGEEELGPTVASLSLGADATMCWRPKTRSSISKSNNNSGTKPDILRIRLEHGDLMVMHGAKIQKLYDHKVVPHGQLRFALTSRFMVPENIKNDADREMAAVKGALPPGHEQYDYDGDGWPAVSDDMRVVNEMVDKLTRGQLQRLYATVGTKLAHF